MKSSEREAREAIERWRRINEYRAEFQRRVAAGQNSTLPQFKMTQLVRDQLAYENKLDRKSRRTA